ncbi:MAG: hypothetical protein K0R51_61 [Cytophagaceae bacterium]|nr:hypothetical protein [Cytophagaceae bacterium]
MKTSTTIFTFLLFFLINLPTFAQHSEKQLVGSWKHYDVVDRLGAHVTIDLKPFDLTLRKDHRFVMTGQGMVSKGSWFLKKGVLELNIEPTYDRNARTQKLYVEKLTNETLTVEIKDFEVTGGLIIVMHRMK